MLFLTPRNSNAAVFVPANITQKLNQIDICSVRHMYEQCFIKGNNCVLNHDKGMNQPRQVHALLTAVKRCKPSLIVCQRTSLSKWCYELSFGLKIILATEITEDTKLNSIDVVLVPHDQLKLIKNTLIDEWFLFVVDDIELVIQSRFIKNVFVDFRIAITQHNFLLHPDADLQWKILKWTNPDMIENKDSFIQTDKFNKRNLLEPFATYWQRLSWDLFDNCKPTVASIEAYESEVEDWCYSNMPVELKSPDIKPRSTRKSASKRQTSRNPSVKPKKRKVLTKKKREPDVLSKRLKTEDSEKTDVTKENKFKSISASVTINTEPKQTHVAFDNSPSSSEADNVKSTLAPVENTDVLETKTPKAKAYNFMSDEEDPILNSLFMEVPTSHQTCANVDNSSSDTEEYPLLKTVLNHAQTQRPSTMTDRQSPKVDTDTNFILDSLVESPQPVVSNVGNTDDEDSCAVLDLLL